MEERLYYKVLRVDKETGQLISAIMLSKYSRKGKNYREMYNGPLGVFETEKDALKFMKLNRVLCPQRYFYALFSCKIEESDFKAFWREGGRTVIYGIPIGTVFAESVELVGRIL